MTDPVKLASPFTVGDKVRPKESSDVRMLWGERTGPGRIVRVLDYGGHVVREQDGREFPYGPYELEHAGD
jgi:hypothetical protein